MGSNSPPPKGTQGRQDIRLLEEASAIHPNPARKAPAAVPDDVAFKDIRRAYTPPPPHKGLFATGADKLSDMAAHAKGRGKLLLGAGALALGTAAAVAGYFSSDEPSAPPLHALGEIKPITVAPAPVDEKSVSRLKRDLMAAATRGESPEGRQEFSRLSGCQTGVAARILDPIFKNAARIPAEETIEDLKNSRSAIRQASAQECGRQAGMSEEERGRMNDFIGQKLAPLLSGPGGS